ncbi:hypothetical protein Phab24_id160 [Acinetobacter phage Phab24]|nr:hypothetical protein Phab24_id160 [Acinetobacter phage Phab24]
MKTYLQEFKESMVKKRSTGRTRRMIFEAARQVFLEGRSVVIIAKTEASKVEISAQVSKYFNKSISNNIDVKSIEYSGEYLKSLDKDKVVLHDHYCFEQDLLNLMEKYTMYDK